MEIIIRKEMRKGYKDIRGKLLQNGALTVAVVVTDKNGNQSIKRFDKTKCKIIPIQ